MAAMAEMNRPVRVLIVDDGPLVRIALAMIIDGSPDLTRVAAADVRQARHLRPGRGSHFVVPRRHVEGAQRHVDGHAPRGRRRCPAAQRRAVDPRHARRNRAGRLHLAQLTGSADEFGEASKDSRYGFGRLNVLRAIALARSVGTEGMQ
jgi:hypothetical protein